MKKQKVIVMFSGGLDSLLAVKIIQKQDFGIIAVYFKLPFIKDVEKEIKEFIEKEKIKLNIFDCTQGKLFQDYLEIIKKPKCGYGAGMNPCIDCRVFMLKKTKEYADKEGVEIIVTGEVLGERPMSQTKRAMDFIEEESGLKGRLFRPLSAKLLPEINAKKKGIINRENFYDIQGRRREPQITLAKKFKIKYPHPAGGCLLCEKALKKRFRFILERGINENEIKLISVGRHFLIDKCWVILGRNEEENKIIESVKVGELIVPDFPAPSAVVFDKCKKQTKEKINKLIKSYSKQGSLKQRKKFERWKL
ncbi:hypothetical protein KAJ87_04015 [Candidatus Pacearchaeota archaeon]|nr:hypothetical protein [Candidatus Pacearchaeota archaeon]